MPQTLRSIFAVFAGFVCMAICVIVLTLVTVKLMGIQSGHPTPVYLFLNVFYSVGAGFLGGWVTGVLAKRNAVAHGLVLAGIMLVLGIFGLKNPAPGQSMMYLILITLACPLAAVLGARFSARTSA